MAEPCISIGLSGCDKNDHIPGGVIWMLHWLPKGYAPTKEDRLLGVFFDTDGRWNDYGLGGKRPLPPLLAAVKKAIEDHLREHPEDAAGHLESKDWSDGTQTIEGSVVGPALPPS